NRFNGGYCDGDGRFWAGTMALTMEDGAGALYRLDADLSVHTMLSGVTISNGMAWSQDQRTLYYIDTPTRTVTAFDFTAETGEIGNGRVALTIPATMGYPDGMTIDRDGKLWIAHYDGGCVRRWDPETGNVLATIPLPVSKVTACTFGGPNLDRLYITTASQEMSDEQKAAEPLAGSLFVAQTPYQGFVTSRFAG
ncbi:MAG: SMP-30/gluconolactonase/LRE family protein, partial [Anaerolineales bacterium]|nr:SMP-30/gluconolactonase/LRE family protein [Anaerolineales bacterium]